MRERAARPVQPLPAWIALWTSTAFHALLLVSVVLVGGSGEPDAGGEGGVAGAGGDTFEVTVVQGTLQPAPVVETDSVRQPETEPETEPESENAPTPAPPVLTARDRDRDRERAPAPAQAPAATAPDAEPAPLATAVGRPEGGEQSHQGRAAGDPEAAAVILGSVGLGVGGPGPRALLERALECGDPIAGVWVAHRFSPEFHDWARMTLRIEREGEQLRGTIVSRTWTGLATDRRPPGTCSPESHDVTVRMQARGWIRGEDFSFGADTHEIQRMDCPSPFFSYNPDRFSGHLDTLREELDTVNNDGGRDVNAPYRFRRTACLDE